MKSYARRLSLAGLAAAALLALLLPGTAAAETRPITFDLSMRANCFGGDASDNATIGLVWRNAAGAIKLSTTVTAASWGRWGVCASTSKSLKPGDTLKATVGSASRKFVIPDLTIVVDRVNDVLRGKGPAGAPLALSYHAGIFADYWQQAATTVDANGNWAYTGDPEDGDISIIGGIDADVQWLSAKGDSVYANGMAPYLRVRLGQSTFAGETNPGQSVKVVLRDPATDAFKARGTAIGSEPGAISGLQGGFASQLLDMGGNPVALAAGDHLVAPSIASDADWIVPNIEASANPSTEVVSGRCFDAGWLGQGSAIVDVYRTGQLRGRALISTDDEGYFEVDMWRPETLFFDPANIKHGDRIVIECLQSTGDWVEMGFRVP